MHVCVVVCVCAWVCVGVGGIPVLGTTVSMVLFENQFFGIIKIVILMYRSIRSTVLSLVNSRSTIGLLTNMQHFEPFRYHFISIWFCFPFIFVPFRLRFVSVPYHSVTVLLNLWKLPGN